MILMFEDEKSELRRLGLGVNYCGQGYSTVTVTFPHPTRNSCQHPTSPSTVSELGPVQNQPTVKTGATRVTLVSNIQKGH